MCCAYFSVSSSFRSFRITFSENSAADRIYVRRCRGLHKPTLGSVLSSSSHVQVSENGCARNLSCLSWGFRKSAKRKLEFWIQATLGKLARCRIPASELWITPRMPTADPTSRQFSKDAFYTGTLARGEAYKTQSPRTWEICSFLNRNRSWSSSLRPSRVRMDVEIIFKTLELYCNAWFITPWCGV